VNTTATCRQDEINRAVCNSPRIYRYYLHTALTPPESACLAEYRPQIEGLPERSGVPLLRNVFRRNRVPVDGFAVAQLLERSQGSRLALTAQIVYRERRDYWINGLVAATVARMLAGGKGVRAGVHLPADAVEDRSGFMAEPRNAGVDATDHLTSSV